MRNLRPALTRAFHGLAIVGLFASCQASSRELAQQTTWPLGTHVAHPPHGDGPFGAGITFEQQGPGDTIRASTVHHLANQARFDGPKAPPQTIDGHGWFRLGSMADQSPAFNGPNFLEPLACITRARYFPEPAAYLEASWDSFVFSCLSGHLDKLATPTVTAGGTLSVVLVPDAGQAERPHAGSPWEINWRGKWMASDSPTLPAHVHLAPAQLEGYGDWDALSVTLQPIPLVDGQVENLGIRYNEGDQDLDRPEMWISFGGLLVTRASN